MGLNLRSVWPCLFGSGLLDPDVLVKEVFFPVFSSSFLSLALKFLPVNGLVAALEGLGPSFLASFCTSCLFVSDLSS